MSRLNLITSCTNSKHNNGHSVLNLAIFSEKYKTPKGLIHAWGEAVNSALSTKLVVPVEKLYKGGIGQRQCQYMTLNPLNYGFFQLVLDC